MSNLSFSHSFNFLIKGGRGNEVIDFIIAINVLKHFYGIENLTLQNCFKCIIMLWL